MDLLRAFGQMFPEQVDNKLSRVRKAECEPHPENINCFRQIIES